MRNGVSSPKRINGLTHEQRLCLASSSRFCFHDELGVLCKMRSCVWRTGAREIMCASSSPRCHLFTQEVYIRQSARCGPTVIRPRSFDRDLAALADSSGFKFVP